MFLLHSEPFEIDVPGRKPKLEVSDAPDPRTSRLLYRQNLEISQFVSSSSQLLRAFDCEL